MATNAGPKIEIDDLDFVLDAANPRSYPRNGSNWKGLKRKNNFALTNNPSFNTANGGFFTFDGTDDYVDLGDLSSQLSNVTQYSIGCWFYIPDITVAGNGGILGRNNNTPSQLSIMFSGVRLRIRSKNDRVKYGQIDISTITSNNKWTHLFVVFDGSGTGNAERLKCFIDGEQVTLSFTGTINSTTGTVSATDYTLGRGRSNYLDGGISNFKIYKRALSARRILGNYKATRGRYT